MAHDLTDRALDLPIASRTRLLARLIAALDADRETRRRWLERRAVVQVLERLAARVHLPEDPTCGCCGQGSARMVGHHDVHVCQPCCEVLVKLVEP
ncbi:MAG TPA: hypothetical protein VGO93_01375 [Candidatus Xenobia bacterium]|jgi:hypothetical protein